MAKRGGTTQYWTEDQERFYEHLLAGCSNPTIRHLVTTIRDLIKYDQRTKAGKRAIAQARLRLATANDEELADLARLQAQIGGNSSPHQLAKLTLGLKQLRQSVRDKGIRKKEITG